MFAALIRQEEQGIDFGAQERDLKRRDEGHINHKHCHADLPAQHSIAHWVQDQVIFVHECVQADLFNEAELAAHRKPMLLRIRWARPHFTHLFGFVCLLLSTYSWFVTLYMCVT